MLARNHGEVSMARAAHETAATPTPSLLGLLDRFRAAEALGAEALGAWLECCRVPALRGGLRTICERERFHAALLEQRLLELGGECRFEIPEETRRRALDGLRSTEVSDAQKLAGVVSGLGGETEEIRRLALAIVDDDETRGLLLTILDDETATAAWLTRTCEELQEP